MTVQNAMPPHTIRCLKCGQEWVPEPTRSGPSKGQHTDASLQRSSDQHMKKHQRAALTQRWNSVDAASGNKS